MKIVQDALQPTGIPAYANAWKPTMQHARAPDSYIVYTTMMVETEHWDDRNRTFRAYVYLNLWTKTDPTEAVCSIRRAMRAAGFSMSQEIDSYDEDTGYMLTACTWLIDLEDDPDGA